MIQISGADFAYLPRETVNLDNLFHEDALVKFTSNYLIEMYIDSFQDFEGIGDQITRFGLEVNDQFRLICSRERFLQVTERILPTEGDLLYYPVSKHLFEIKYVNDKSPLYALTSRFYFSLDCEVFKYSNEELDTGTDADQPYKEWYNDGSTIPDTYDRNTDLETLGDGVLDFTETNPFGEVS